MRRFCFMAFFEFLKICHRACAPGAGRCEVICMHDVQGALSISTAGLNELNAAPHGCLNGLITASILLSVTDVVRKRHVGVLVTVIPGSTQRNTSVQYFQIQLLGRKTDERGNRVAIDTSKLHGEVLSYLWSEECISIKCEQLLRI